MPNIAQRNISQKQKLTKYLLMGLVIFISSRYIPDNLIQTKEAIMIGVTSVITFAILDTISPSVNIDIPSEEKSPIVEKFI